LFEPKFTKEVFLFADSFKGQLLSEHSSCFLKTVWSLKSIGMHNNLVLQGLLKSLHKCRKWVRLQQVATEQRHLKN